LANRGRTGLVFSSLDGLDEISITAPTKIWQVVGGEVAESTSSVFVDKAVSLEQLLGGDAKENAEIAMELFSGNISGNFAAIKKVVLANAAAGIVAYELAKNPEAATIDLDLRLENAFTLATAALEDGRANELLGRWKAATS
jgi:anthranilate phosphoribosyltransferase